MEARKTSTQFKQAWSHAGGVLDKSTPGPKFPGMVEFKQEIGYVLETPILFKSAKEFMESYKVEPTDIQVSMAAVPTATDSEKTEPMAVLRDDRPGMGERRGILFHRVYHVLSMPKLTLENNLSETQAASWMKKLVDADVARRDRHLHPDKVCAEVTPLSVAKQKSLELLAQRKTDEERGAAGFSIQTAASGSQAQPQAQAFDARDALLCRPSIATPGPPGQVAPKVGSKRAMPKVGTGAAGGGAAAGVIRPKAKAKSFLGRSRLRQTDSGGDAAVAGDGRSPASPVPTALRRSPNELTPSVATPPSSSKFSSEVDLNCLGGESPEGCTQEEEITRIITGKGDARKFAGASRPVVILAGWKPHWVGPLVPKLL